jgi:hypothetical protein
MSRASSCVRHRSSAILVSMGGVSEVLTAEEAKALLELCRAGTSIATSWSPSRPTPPL